MENEVGNVVVIVNDNNSYYQPEPDERKIGSMFRVGEVSHQGSKFFLRKTKGVTQGTPQNDCRLANGEELIAFGKGITHIDKIKVMKEEFQVGDWIKITTRQSGVGNTNNNMERRDGDIVQITSINGDAIKFKGDGNWTWRFKDGHFKRVEAPTKAEVHVHFQTEFEDGDYIVITPDKKDTCFPKDFIFKQRTRDTYLRPYLDAKGNKANGWIIIQTKDQTNWRPATEEEIKEYNRLGKPFDVTTFKPMWKTGTIVVSLKEVTGRRRVGDIFTVLEGSNDNVIYYAFTTNGKTSEFRLATPEEREYFFCNGGKNISGMEDIKIDELGVKAGDWIEFNNSGGLCNGKLIHNTPYKLIKINQESSYGSDKDWILEDQKGNRVRVRLKGENYPYHTYWKKVLEEVKVDLNGRYLKALVPRVEGISGGEVGDMFLIVNEQYNTIRDKNGKSWVYTPGRIGEVWELMPEGFKPEETIKPKTESKFKVGDVVIGNKKASINYAITGYGIKLLVTKINEHDFEGKTVNNGQEFYNLRLDCFDLVSSFNNDSDIIVTTDNPDKWVSVSPQQIKETFGFIASKVDDELTIIHHQKPRIIDL